MRAYEVERPASCFICGSGAGDLKGRYVAGVFAEFYGDQVDGLVKAAVFVRVTSFFIDMTQVSH